MGEGLIPPQVLEAITRAELPCFVFDTVAIKQRLALAESLVDRYFFPVKACPEPDVVRATVAAGCGLDLCSQGDLDIAINAGCPGSRWKFTAASADDALLRRLVDAGASLDADSIEQALRWAACGGKTCGLRITARSPNPLYRSKFGMPARDVSDAARKLTAAGVRVIGVHLHDQHANLTPGEFATRLLENFSEIDPEFLSTCLYVNTGGSWPMRHSNPASPEDLREAFSILRQGLRAIGFAGQLYAEAGRWVVGPCGYWAARVAAVKPHPVGSDHRVLVLDTNTPVPCRPFLTPFVALQNGIPLNAPRTLTCDIFGSANTALDIIGENVRLPFVSLGDVIVLAGQGAYTRSLIPPFNERNRPAAIVIQ